MKSTRRRTTRRLGLMLAGVLAGALALSACGSSNNGSSGTTTPPTTTGPTTGATTGGSGGGATETVRVSILPIADLAPLFYGVDNGIFAKHGIKVDPVVSTGGAAGISAMLSGSVQFVYTNTVSVFLARTQNLPVVITSGANDNVPEGDKDMAGMLVSKDITSAKQLEGKTVASNALNNINMIYAQAWMKKEGVDISKVKFVEIPFPEQVAALESNKIQGTLIPEPFLSQGMQSGLKVLGWPYRIGTGGTTPVGVYVASNDWAKAHSDTVKKFTDAMTEATEAVNDPANKTKVIESILNHTKLQRSDVENMQLSTYTTDVKTDLLKEEEQLLRDMGVLKTDVNVDDMVFSG